MKTLQSLAALTLFFVVLPAIALAQDLSALSNPMAIVQILFDGVKSGDYLVVAWALLILTMVAIRSGGPWLHAKLPDHTLVDKALGFLFDTKPGGWLLNALTGTAGGVAFALLNDERPTWALVKPIVAVTFGGAGLWEFGKDFWAWWQARKAPKA